MNPADKPGHDVVEADVPQVELARYITELRTATQGLGTYSWRPERFDPVPGKVDGTKGRRLGIAKRAPVPCTLWRILARETSLRVGSAGALLAGCTQTGGGASGSAPGGQAGTLRIAIQSDLKNLNPLLNSNTTDAMVARLMFEPLLSADPTGQPVPMLATTVPTLQNGGVSKDGLTITYHLRKDAKWTDGVPVTGKDVKWSWQAIMNKNNNIISQHGYDYVKSIDLPDDHTVVVHLKEKFSPFVNTFFADSDRSRIRSRRRTCSRRIPTSTTCRSMQTRM